MMMIKSLLLGLWAPLALLPCLSTSQSAVVSSTTTTAYLHLNGDSITVDPTDFAGATVSTINDDDGGNKPVVTITAAGEYTIDGSLDDGQIRVDASDSAQVVLALNGTTIRSSFSAPILVINADKTILSLMAGTENRISDASMYSVFLDNDDDDKVEPNAAIFAKDDLDIEGEGVLIVEGNYNHGIATNDDLKIKGGIMIITAVNDGIKGRDSIQISGTASITIDAHGDGIQSNKGYISIEGNDAHVDVTASEDGIQADSDISILGGDITIVTGGGNNGTQSSDSTKGIKADGDVTIQNGTFHINASDDAIHADGDLQIHAGSFWLSSADDGIKGNTSVTIHGGDINITESYEGISGNVVTINGGTIHIQSSDDGISVGKRGEMPGMGPGGGGGGPPPAMQEIFKLIRDPHNTEPLPCPIQDRQQPGGASPFPFGGPGGGDGDGPGAVPVSSDDYILTINGGYIYIDSGFGGDGIDSNGHITITGGTMIVNGPPMLLNGAFDTEGNLTVSGGTALGVGSNGMAQSPSSATSSQLSVRYLFEDLLQPGTIIHLESQSSGQVMFTFAPTKEFQSFVFTSPDLVMGETYLIFVGGSVEGPHVDGLYHHEGTYTPGTNVANLTLTEMVTNESNGFDRLNAIMFSGCNFTDGQTFPPPMQSNNRPVPPTQNNGGGSTTSSGPPTTENGGTEQEEDAVSKQSSNDLSAVEESSSKAGTYFLSVPLLVIVLELLLLQ